MRLRLRMRMRMPSVRLNNCHKNHAAEIILSPFIIALSQRQSIVVADPVASSASDPGWLTCSCCYYCDWRVLKVTPRTLNQVPPVPPLSPTPTTHPTSPPVDSVIHKLLKNHSTNKPGSRIPGPVVSSQEPRVLGRQVNKIHHLAT